MGVCNLVSGFNLPQVQLLDESKRLPWPELKTGLKNLFILDNKNHSVFLDLTDLTQTEKEDFWKIEEFVITNGLHYHTCIGFSEFPFSGFPQSWFFCSVWNFEIDEKRGQIYHKVDGLARKFNPMPIYEPELIGLA